MEGITWGLFFVAELVYTFGTWRRDRYMFNIYEYFFESEKESADAV